MNGSVRNEVLDNVSLSLKAKWVTKILELGHFQIKDDI